MPSQWEDKSKPHRNIVFVGHVDHGKSTTVGRLLLDSGHIEEHVIEKNEKLAAEAGKAGFGLAYVCLLYTSPSPRDRTRSRMPSSA